MVTLIGIGSSIFPSNPEIGVSIFIFFLFLIVFLLWYYNILEMFKRWKRKDEINRKIKYKREKDFI